MLSQRMLVLTYLLFSFHVPVFLRLFFLSFICDLFSIMQSNMLDELQDFFHANQFSQLPDLDSELEDDSGMEPVHVSRPLLRSRPHINFSGSGLSMDLDCPLTMSTTPHFTALSGSTLHSRSDLNSQKPKCSKFSPE